MHEGYGTVCKRFLYACRELCVKLAPSGQQLVDSFGIPLHLVAAPIAEDWEGYNVTDNQGELITTRNSVKSNWNRQKESELNALVAGAAIA